MDKKYLLGGETIKRRKNGRREKEPKRNVKEKNYFLFVVKYFIK